MQPTGDTPGRGAVAVGKPRDIKRGVSGHATVATSTGNLASLHQNLSPCDEEIKLVPGVGVEPTLLS
jgi:hypothetical protein